MGNSLADSFLNDSPQHTLINNAVLTLNWRKALRLSASLLFFLPLLASCSSSLPATSVPPPSPLTSADRARAHSNELTPKSQSADGASNDLLYVGNVGNNSITVYQHDQQGNTAPKYVIAGSNTGLTSPGQLSEDAQGNLYVANGASLLVFAHGANGNVAPIRTLMGPTTGIHRIEAMTVDRTTGKIFVTDVVETGFPAAAVLRFPPNASGNTRPFARAEMGAFLPTITSDSTGNNLIITESVGPDLNDQSVVTIAKQFPNGGPTPTLYGIGAVQPLSVTDDPATKTYLMMVGQIYRFAEITDGQFPIFGQPAKFTPPLISTITSETCGSQVVLGYLRNIYVSHSQQGGGCPADAVYVYTHDASGNATPLRILTGPATRLTAPYGIYEGV